MNKTETKETKFDMNLFKTITIMVLAVMLTLAISFNIFILAIFEIKDVQSFKQVLLCRELLNSMGQISGNAPEADDTTDSSESFEEVPNETPSVDATPTEPLVVYNENNIKITYVKQELGLLGPTLEFHIENNTDRTITIDFTNVYIDGYIAELSGGICDSLEAGKKAFTSLTLWEVDYEDFTDSPEKVEFIIRLRDSDSWNTLVESEPIHINMT